MLTLKQAQKITKDWIGKKGFKWSAYAAYCHLVEEVGELGEAHGEREAGSGELGYADHSDMEEELADVLFSIMDIANRYDIDLEESFKKTMKRYDKKVELRK